MLPTKTLMPLEPMTSAPQLLSHHLFAQVVKEEKEKEELLEEELVDEEVDEKAELEKPINM